MPTFASLFSLANSSITGVNWRQGPHQVAQKSTRTGASPETIQAALSRYRGAAHRLEHIGTIHGADFYNDSKATNVDAAVKALGAFKRIRWICGGLEKEGGMAALAPAAGEVVKAYVVLNPGHAPSDELERELRGFARKRLGPAVAPREIVFRESLPRTRSGKIMRRLLKARELGLPEGDISTLETDET